MNNKSKKNLSIAYHIFYISAVILIVCGLTFLLSSCTEEMIEGQKKPYTGPKIAVKFTFGGVSAQGSEVLTRSRISSPIPSEGSEHLSLFGGGGGDVSIIPVTDDIYMYTTVEEDREVRLRGIIPIDDGAKIRIVAYENGTTYRTHVDYTIVNNGKLSDELFQVNPGYYKFVAYSYNTGTLPTHDNETISSIDPATDLLWGCFPASGTYHIVESSMDEIPITLSHKFSQVKLLVTAIDIPGSPRILALDDVRILPDHSVTLEIKTGNLSPGNSAVQRFSTWSGMGLSTTVTSELRTVYTQKANPTTVSFGTLRLDGYPPVFSQDAIFNKQLQCGISYTLKVTFKQGETTILVVPDYVTLSFAAHTPASQSLSVICMKGPNPDPTAQWTLTSNQPSWLTLSLNANGSGASTSVSGTGSQTVYLVATANTGNSDRHAGVYLHNKNPWEVDATIVQDFLTTIGETGEAGERIYIDTNGGDPKLMLTQNPTNKGAMFQFGGVRGWNAGSNAGNANYNPTPIDSRWSSTWEYSIKGQGTPVEHTLANLRAGKGDPCRLVGYTQTEIRNAIATTNSSNAYAPDNKLWRLPTGNEFIAYASNHDRKSTLSGVSGYKVGNPRVFLPIIGYINYNGNFVSGDGDYWSSYKIINLSGLPSGNNASYLRLRGDQDNTVIIDSFNQAYGLSIRCVRQ